MKMHNMKQTTSASSAEIHWKESRLKPGYYHHTSDDSYALVQWRERLAGRDSDCRIVYYHPNYPIDKQYFFHELKEKDLDPTFVATFVPIADPSVLAKLLLVGFQFPLVAYRGIWTY
jgi:hypothetical protein